MSRQDHMIAIRVDDITEVHATGGSGVDYATLCGLDGDDPGAGQYPAELPKQAKIDCVACRQIFERARQLRKTDFKD